MYKNAVEYNRFFEFKGIETKIIDFQKTLTNSEFFTEYTKLKVIKDATAEVDEIPKDQLDSKDKLSRQSIINHTNNQDKIYYQIKKEINDEIDTVCKEKNEIIENKNAIILELKKKINTLEGQIAKINEGNHSQMEEIKSQCLNFQADSDEKLQKLKEDFEVEMNSKEKSTQANLTKILEKMYEMNIKEGISIDLGKEDDNNLAMSQVKCKFRIPEVNRITVKNIQNDDPILDSFLDECFPEKLDSCLLRSKSSKLTDFKPYSCSLSKAIKGVVREICLHKFCFNSDDLENVVKSSKKCERLIISHSEVHCSEEINFTTDSDYCIKFLSFVGCGKFEETEWIKEPTSFERIVVAIKNSGLKDSLETVEINDCGLKRTEVRDMFTKHGLEKTKVLNKKSKA